MQKNREYGYPVAPSGVNMFGHTMHKSAHLREHHTDPECPICRFETMDAAYSHLLLSVKTLIREGHGRGRPAHRSQLLVGMKRIVADAEVMRAA